MPAPQRTFRSAGRRRRQRLRRTVVVLATLCVLGGAARYAVASDGHPVPTGGSASAWRSAQWQGVLFDRAVQRYGSRADAGTWVLPPGDSAHVKGHAVDVEPRSAASWLEAHGADYGLCRTYENEWWHFEYLATHSCPPRRMDAAGG